MPTPCAPRCPRRRPSSLTSGFPTPQSDVAWRDRDVGDVLVFGVTPPYQEVQDYRFAAGDPLTEVDDRAAARGGRARADIADKLFDGAQPVGQDVQPRRRALSRSSA